MRIKLLCFLLVLLCAAVLCVQFAQSTAARNASATAIKKSVYSAGKASIKASVPKPTVLASAKMTSTPTKLASAKPDDYSGIDPVAPRDNVSSTLHRWECDSKLKEVENDEQAVRDLMESYQAATAKIFSQKVNRVSY